ncbi:MAG: lamin tail domain-containing protein [Phycisphaerae bacterium]|nr:lamin tail domain-containing protein [Phycisphaerae bacterium]
MVESVRLALVASLAVLVAFLCVPPACAAVPLVLNELMASNASTTADPQGDYDDWIEMRNASLAPVNAAGLYLTDDPEVPTRWQIPFDKAALTTITPGGFLLIWADGETTDPGLHANFKLGADGGGLYLFDADGVTLLDYVVYGEQLPDVSYGRSPDATGDWGFLTAATPGTSNAQAAMGVVSDVRFSRERGFYETSFDVALSCDTPGATIYYTTDGSDPGQPSDRIGAVDGTAYTQPIHVAKTTCLRAAAVKTDWISSPAAAHTYLFLANVALQSTKPTGFPTTWGSVPADYEMDSDILSNSQYSGQLNAALKSLPSMSLVMDVDDLFDSKTGIYSNSNAGNNDPSWERPGSVELIYPDGTEGFQINCGIQIQGAWFRQPGNCRKHSFRLGFKGEYGPTKLRYPLFGPDAAREFDTLVLRAGANDGYTWAGNETNAQFTRDEFVRNLQLDTGNAASHGTFVHLYVNGLYWGLYNPCERPDGTFSSTYYGGEKDDWDVLKHTSFTVDQGNKTALNQMLSLCQQAASSDVAFQRLQGRDADGTPRSDYPCLLDVPNYIDYMIVNMWAGNWDWPWNNYWLARDRTAASTGFKFYCWDGEDVMLSSRSPLNMDKITSPDSGQVGQPHGSLRNNAEYRLLFADRLHRLFFNEGILTSDSLISRYTAMANFIELAIIPEAARWADQNGSGATPAHWTAMRNKILQSYLPQRSAIVLGQFRNAGLYPSVEAPVFYVNGSYRHGGPILSTDSLFMQADTTIHYTLDGTDPRAPESTGGTDGQVAIVKESASKKVLVPTAAISDAWKGGAAFDDSAWIAGAGGVGYEYATGFETYFSIDVGSRMYQRTSSCYIRIPFSVTVEDIVSLMGLTLSVRCDDGFVAYLNGTEIARKNFAGTPVWNSNTTGNASNPDDSAVLFESFNVTAPISRLLPGTNILAIQAMNSSAQSSDFLLSVELAASKAVTEEVPTEVSTAALRYAGPITLSHSVCVKARSLSGSTWSALNEAVYSVGRVAENLRVSEILYHPEGDPNAEFIELTNVGDETIHLNLVRFTRGIQYTFPSFELAAGSYCLLVRDIASFEARYGNQLAVVGQYEGNLDNAGEQIELLDAVGEVIQSFEYEDDWFDLTDGSGFSLTVRDPSSDYDLGSKSAWRPSASANGSPGSDDTGQVPEPGSVVINELLSNPAGGGSDWIELHNTTAEAIDLAGWYLSDDADDLTKYEIGAGTSIPAGGYVVFYQDQHFGNDADPGCSTSFGLSKNGETVYLHSGSGGVLTGYSEQEKFDASEPGVSFGRWQKSTGSYNFVALSEPTPGMANADPVVGPIVINEIMYHPSGSEETEYVELLNISDSTATLYDATQQAPWRFTDDPDDPAIELLFPSDSPVTLAPGEYLVLTKDLTAFKATYTVPAGVQVLAWTFGRLTNGGEKVQLSRPGEREDDGTRQWIRVDRVAYSDGSHPEDFADGVDPWPVAADGQGKSLSRIDPQTYGNDPANWQPATPTPGRPNP